MLRFAILSRAIVLAVARGVSAQQREALRAAGQSLVVDRFQIELG
jgi:hypothetical protein